MSGGVTGGADLVNSLPDWAFAFLLVLSRCSMAVILLPGLGEAEAPATLRLGLALALTILVLPGVGTVAPADAWHTAAMVGAELLYGGLLGSLARLITLALPMAGQITSFMLGLSSVVQPDPVLGQSSALMRLFSVVAPVLVLSSGLWKLPVTALASSYGVAPPGTMVAIGDGTEAFIAAVGASFSLALRLSAPYIFASVVWQVAMGFTGRLVPHLQVYFAAIPGQIVGGLAMLALLSAGMLEGWAEAARQGLGALPGL